MKPFAQLTHFAGFDWAKQHHQVVILDARGQTVAALRFAHDAEGWQQFRQRLTAFPSLGVAIETCQGAAVEKLLESGVTVYPIAPKRAQAYRQRHPESFRGKSDFVDAWSMGDALRLDGAAWKPLAAEDPVVQPRHCVSGLCRDEVALISPDIRCRGQPTPTSPARVLPRRAGSVRRLDAALRLGLRGRVPDSDGLGHRRETQMGKVPARAQTLAARHR